MNKFIFTLCFFIISFSVRTYSQNTTFTNRATFESNVICNPFLQENFNSFSSSQPVTQILGGSVQITSAAQTANIGTLAPDISGDRKSVV